MEEIKNDIAKGKILCERQKNYDRKLEIGGYYAGGKISDDRKISDSCGRI